MRRARVLLAEVGDPAGDGAALTAAARALRDAGHEAVLTGPGQTPEHVLAAAVAEDVDAIGVATAGGDAVERVRALCREQALDDVTVFGLDGDPAAAVRRVQDL
jgi:methylmalonyl-CoA mutase, C-terminal domain